jgi:hypothetical protein
MFVLFKFFFCLSCFFFNLASLRFMDYGPFPDFWATCFSNVSAYTLLYCFVGVDFYNDYGS